MDGICSNRMFCIVDFVGGRKRLVVPDTWLSINDTLCLLPPDATDSDVDAMARNLAEPGEGWKMLQVSSVETFESYSEAKKQLKRTKDASHSEVSSSQRKRKKPSFLEDYSTRDSDDSRMPYTVFGMDSDEEAITEHEWIPPPEVTPRIGNVSTARKTIHNDHRPRSRRFNQSQLSSQKENIDIPCDCPSSCHSSFVNALHVMQKQLNMTNQMMQQLLEGQKKTHSQLERVLQPLTVNHIKGPEEMDDFSQDDTNSTQSVLMNKSTTAALKRTTIFPEDGDTCSTGDQPSTTEVLPNKSPTAALKRTTIFSEAEDTCSTGDQTSTAKVLLNESTTAAPNTRTIFSEDGDTCSTGDQPSTTEIPDLPVFERSVQEALQKGTLMQSRLWGSFIMQTAAHYMKCQHMNTSTAYNIVGRKMYEKYPCIGVAGIKPWRKFARALSNKIRKIRCVEKACKNVENKISPQLQCMDVTEKKCTKNSVIGRKTT